MSELAKSAGRGLLFGVAIYAVMQWFSEHRMGFSFYIHDRKPPLTIFHEWSPDFRPEHHPSELPREHKI